MSNLSEEEIKKLKNLINNKERFYYENDFNNIIRPLVGKLFNLYISETEKNKFIINENLNDIYERTLEKTMDKYIKKEVAKDFIHKDKIKEKMQNDIKTNEHVILGGRRNGRTLEYGKRLGRIEMCEELLKGE